MPYGIVVLPPVNVAKRITAYANEVASLRVEQLLTVVSESTEPHLTLLHVECTEEIALALWSSSLDVLGFAMPVSITGVGRSYHPSRDDPDVDDSYFSLAAESTNALRAAHAGVAARAAALGATPISATGESYSPHITLCVGRGHPNTTVPINPGLVPSSFQGRFALVSVQADFGSVTSILRAGRQ